MERVYQSRRAKRQWANSLEVNKMKILKQYKGEDTWKEVSLDEALRMLEDAYVTETIIPMLKEGATLQTMYSFYKVKSKK